MLCIFLMILSAVGMIYGLKETKKNKPIGKPITAVSIAFALLFALLHTCSQGGTDIKDIIAKEMQYTKASTIILGQQLAKIAPGSKALVIIKPKTNYNKDRENALLDGLKEGLETGDISIAALVALQVPKEAKRQMPEGMYEVPPIEYWFTAKIFNEVIEKNKDCDLIISLVGLPPSQKELSQIKLWSMKEGERPKLAIINTPVYDLMPLFTEKLISVAVSYNPNAVYDEEQPPKEVRAAFDKRYILITDDNVADVSAKFSGMFNPEKGNTSEKKKKKTK
ncbi:MAG: hypothetical protein U9O87_00650 [Verrucomicrobiota bacterium]|nr:hypothetical protein [Verrucomicrobiota bacterium]